MLTNSIFLLFLERKKETFCVFQDFHGPRHNFKDFPGLGNFFPLFQDFSGLGKFFPLFQDFSGLSRTVATVISSSRHHAGDSCFSI